MCIFHFQLIDLNFWVAFCEISPSRGKRKYAILGRSYDENTSEIIYLYTTKPFIFSHIYETTSFEDKISDKGVQFEKYGLSFENQKIHHFQLSPVGLGCDRQKGL